MAWGGNINSGDPYFIRVAICGVRTINSNIVWSRIDRVDDMTTKMNTLQMVLRTLQLVTGRWNSTSCCYLILCCSLSPFAPPRTNVIKDKVQKRQTKRRNGFPSFYGSQCRILIEISFFVPSIVLHLIHNTSLTSLETLSYLFVHIVRTHTFQPTDKERGRERQKNVDDCLPFKKKLEPSP